LFELSWNVLCPGCGGVLDAGATLKTLNREEYACGLCASGYEPILDEMVEVTFTVSSRVRRIAAHSPDTLPEVEYYRQVFWSSAIDLPDSLEEALAHVQQLQGLIPICAWCRQVRNDGNFWEQVDSYLTKRSGLQFTHAICPTCRDREVAQARDSRPT